MLQPQAWYSLRDLAEQLDISMALARFAVLVLSNLGLITTRPMPSRPWSPEVARSALPWIVKAVQPTSSWGSEWDRELSEGANLESLYALASQEGVRFVEWRNPSGRGMVVKVFAVAMGNCIVARGVALEPDVSVRCQITQIIPTDQVSDQFWAATTSLLEFSLSIRIWPPGCGMAQ